MSKIGRLGQGFWGIALAIVPLSLMNCSWQSAAYICFGFFVVAVLINDGVAIFLGLTTALVIDCVLALLLGQFDSTYSISGTLLLIATSLFALMGSMLFRFLRRHSVQQINGFALVAFVAIFLKLTEQSRDWTSAKAFGILVKNGEDNAAWLIALSRSVQINSTVLSAESGVSGGPSTGVFISLFRELFMRIDPTAIVANADNALVLLRMYTIVGVLLALVWFVTALSMLSTQKQIVRSGFAVVSSLIGYAFVMGLAAVGHFSAVVAVFFLSAAVMVHEIKLIGPKNMGGHIQRVLVFLSLTAAGQAWYPLTAVAIIYFAMTVVQIGSQWIKKRQKRGDIVKLIVASPFLVIVSFFVFRKVFPGFFGNAFDLDYIIQNLTLPGGYASVNPWLTIIGISVCLFSGLSRSAIDSLSLSSLVIALFVPIVVLFTWSYFLSPYVPQYGAWKYLYIAVAVAVPWATLIVGKELGKIQSSLSLASVPLVIALVFALLTPPMQNLSWVSSVGKSEDPWIGAIVKELRDNPTRPVVCLNTFKSDEGNNIYAYICSRMAQGLGGFDTYALRTWTAANICQIPPEQAESAWDRDFQRNLTVLTFDTKRTSSFYSCQLPVGDYQNGWLSNIDWNLVRRIDYEGNEVISEPTKRGD